MTHDDLHSIAHENILKYGVHLIGVFDHNPNFTYTIGLTPKFGFELLMIGIPCQYAAAILNDFAALEEPPELDVPNSEFTNLPCMLKRCSVSLGPLHDQFVCQADVHYGREVDVVQVVMCDKAGKFPGDPDFDHAYMDPRQRLFCDF